MKHNPALAKEASLKNCLIQTSLSSKQFLIQEYGKNPLNWDVRIMSLTMSGKVLRAESCCEVWILRPHSSMYPLLTDGPANLLHDASRVTFATLKWMEFELRAQPSHAREDEGPSPKYSKFRRNLHKSTKICVACHNNMDFGGSCTARRLPRV
jgi:hypothetical protein